MKQPDEYVGIERDLTAEEMASALAAQDNPDTEQKNEYLCEVCDAKATLTEAEAFELGWDYPPFIGLWGVVSPRTCPNCLIDQTAYWAVLTRQTLTDRHEATIRRIMAEALPPKEES